MKIYSINDYDWYMAPTLEEAIQQAMKDSGLPRDEACDDPSEVSDDDMKRLKFTRDNDIKVTFQEELDARIAAGRKTEMFASTNY